MDSTQSLVPSPARVFLSSTSYDLAAVRQELESFLQQLGYVPVLFETAAALPSVTGPESALRHAVRCDVCLLVVGARYGASSEDDGISHTQREYRAARDAARPVFAFVHRDTLVKFEMFQADKDSGLWESDQISLFKFVEEISGERTRFPFHDLAGLKESMRYQLVSYFGYLLRTYSELEAVNPRTSSQWNALGQRFWNAARFGQAIYCFRQGSTADEFGDARSCTKRLVHALRTCGRPEEALAIAREGVAKATFPLGLHVHVTNCLFDLGRDSEALVNAETTARAFPRNWRVWNSLRYARFRSGDLEGAQAAVRKLVELAPESLKFRAMLGNFEKLAADATPEFNLESEGDDEIPSGEDPSA